MIAGQEAPVVRGRMFRVVGVSVVIAALAAGLWFRFTAMDRKYFWMDEVHAALLRSGRSEADLFALYDHQPRPLDDLQRMVEIDPQQPFFSTVETLARYHPVHPPLYYAVLRAWTEVAGDSVAATRWLSALFSLLCFPAVYWLAKEVFHSRAAAWTAVALWAVSPFEVLYSQEAKQYSLFAAATMAAGAALLRAMRLRTKGSWCLYAFATAVGLYTHMLFAPVLAAFSAFVFLVHVGRLRRPRTWKLFGSYAAATIVGLLAFAPWPIYSLSIGRAGQHIVAHHMADQQKLAWVVGAWISNVGCMFSDMGYPATVAAACVHVGLWLAALALTAYSFRYLMRRTSRTTWLFLLLLAAIPALSLMVPDLVLGGGRSMLARYWTATSIGVLLAVAGAMSRQFSAPGFVRPAVAGVVTLAVLAVGGVSCTRSSHADYWWNKMGVVNNHRAGAADYDNMLRALKTIGRVPKPLIITEKGRYQECRLLSFTYYLRDPKVQWVGALDPTQIALPADGAVFLFEATATAEYLHKQGWKMRAIEPSGSFLYATRESPPATGVANAGSQ
jgi:uncharacterized membrane protein